MTNAMAPLVWLIFAHLASDLYIRGATDEPESGKIWMRLSPLAFVLLAVPPLWHWMDWTLSVSLLVLIVWRYVLAECKLRLERRLPSRRFLLELVFQCFHFAGLLGLLGVAAGSWTMDTISWPFTNPLALRIGIWLSALSVAGRGGTILVRRLLEQPEAINKRVDERQYRIGRTIGVLERLLILGLTFHGELAAVGFVLAAKSVARFENLKEKEFVEYYLLGTLMSSLVAVATAWALRLVWEALPQL